MVWEARTVVRTVVVQIVFCGNWSACCPAPRPAAHWRRLQNDVLVGAWVSPGLASFLLLIGN